MVSLSDALGKLNNSFIKRYRKFTKKKVYFLIQLLRGWETG